MKSALAIIVVLATAFAAEIPLRPVHPVFAKWNRDEKIVGGSQAFPHSIPHQVALFLGGSFCGGSLIGQRWVLTAAHCGQLTDSPQVILGAHSVEQTEASQVIMTGSRVIIHELWNSANLQNDIALIQLPQNAPINSNIQIIPLASTFGGDYAGNIGTASGWGKSSDSAPSIAHVLRVVQSQILSNSDCQMLFGSAIPVLDTVICLDGRQGKSTCSGDSGGPLTVGGAQVGLTSFGVSIGCERGYPAVFTRISSYRNWITTKTGL